MKQLNIIDNNLIETWNFYDADLFYLVKEGIKTATCYLSSGEEYVEKFSILKSNTGEKLKLETTSAYELTFDEVTSQMAMLEGEGDLSLEYWQKIHLEFFTKELKQVGDTFTNDTKLIFEVFKVLE